MGTLQLNPRPHKSSTGSNFTGYHLSPRVSSWQVSVQSFGWRPPTDVYETEDRFVVKVEIAGMKESDFNVKLDHNHLIISGTRPDNPEPRAFHLVEINYGDFGTEVELLVPVDANSIEAEYKNGFLIVFLPKAKPKSISIGS
jgi:HSP20 family protein